MDQLELPHKEVVRVMYIMDIGLGCLSSRVHITIAVTLSIALIAQSGSLLFHEMVAECLSLTVFSVTVQPYVTCIRAIAHATELCLVRVGRLHVTL